MRVIDVEVVFQTQTDRAVCVNQTDDGFIGADIWIPKSRCEIDPPHPHRGDLITLSTDESMAEEKDLI